MMMAAKLYFYAKNGTELSDNILNGIDHTGSGAVLSNKGIIQDKDGKDGHWTDSKGRYARCTLYGRLGPYHDYNGRCGKEKVITIADFPGHRHVLVKAWYPDQSWNEWFWLVPEQNKLNS